MRKSSRGRPASEPILEGRIREEKALADRLLRGIDWVDWRQEPGEQGFKCDFEKHYWALRQGVDRLR